MSRLTMSSALPVEYCEAASDCLDWPSPAEQYAQSVEIDRKAEELLCSEAWWDSELCGINPATNALPGILARVMANLKSARKGEQIGIDALTTAMSQLEREAKAMARKEVERDLDN